MPAPSPVFFEIEVVRIGGERDVVESMEVDVRGRTGGVDVAGWIPARIVLLLLSLGLRMLLSIVIPRGRSGRMPPLRLRLRGGLRRPSEVPFVFVLVFVLRFFLER